MTIKNKQLSTRSVVTKVSAEDAPVWRPLLKQVCPTRIVDDGSLDREYEEHLRIDCLVTQNWYIVPFSPNRDY